VTEVKGWTLYFHPAFRCTYEALIAEVNLLKAKLDHDAYTAHPKVKLFGRLQSVIFTEVPTDPGAAIYAQGNTLGAAHRHWRRAKFLRRFRLFFRFSSKYKLIIYAWANDENTLRKAGSKTDPYCVFEKRLKAGNPPDNWDDLLAESAG
jgi:toxin YhaV